MRFENGLIGILLDGKLGSDGNQIGEVINEGVGVFGLVPSSPKIGLPAGLIENFGSFLIAFL